jgi:hypothetical protein
MTFSTLSTAEQIARHYSAASEWTEIPETNQLDMILFPSYIKHSVDLMKVDEERVTLAFNAIPNKLSNGPYDIEFKL